MNRLAKIAVPAVVGLCAAMVALPGSAINRKSDIARNILIFNDVYKRLQTAYVDTLDPTQTMRTAIDAMLGQIDPYTEFYNQDEQDNLTSVSTGEYAGIGSIIMKRDTSVVLSQPRWDSPARKAGIRHGDVLLAIDGEALDRNSTTSEASKRLKGRPGSKVTLKVRRPYTPAGHDSVLTFTITRGTIEIDPIPYFEMLDGGIGFVSVSTFSDKTGPEFQEVLAKLRKANGGELKGLIVDMRGNGGGLLMAATDLVSNFVPRGTEVVTTRGRDKTQTRTYKTTRNPSLPDLPLVVLTDGNTASAAEIFSGALQDLDRAVIVGERSFGKGLVQTPGPLPYNTMMKITTGRYYLPSGRLIQAVDYRHRNADGSGSRIPDSLTTAYTTAHGREVRDGGGITPDVNITLPESSLLEYKIITDMFAYDFANKVANRTAAAPDPETWVLSDSLFNEFKTFVDPEKLKYDSPVTSALDYLRKVAKAEGFTTDSVTSAIDRIGVMMHRELNKEMDFRKESIMDIIDSELSQRWFSDGDIIKRSLENDPVVNEAIAVLSDPRRYGVLLSPGMKVGKAPENNANAGAGKNATAQADNSKK